MKLSPIILGAAVCASGQYLYPGAQDQLHARRLEQQQQRLGQRPAKGTAELSTEYFLQVPPATSSAGSRRRDQQTQHSQVASVVSVPAPKPAGKQPASAPAPAGLPPPRPPVHAEPQPLLRPQPWALPLLALSAAAMLLMAAFEVFVLLKARAAAPSRRHLFLGQALLLGLFLLAGLSAAASLTANPISCAAFRLVGLPAALVFAALLVKCVFLLSLNSGVYLPAPYQALVLMFAVLVQVAIVGQWLYGDPSSVLVSGRGLSTACRTPMSQSLAALGYPGLLLLAVTCLAVRARGVRDNYRESWFIGLAVGLVLPTWLASAIGALLAPEPEREAWLSFGLLGTAILVFLAMFLPKGRQLAALGRESSAQVHHHVIHAGGHHHHHHSHRGACSDDQLSCSLPDLAANYSPSFFHYKPAAAAAAQPVLMTVGATESSLKRKPAAQHHYHSADRVALVQAASGTLPGCNACRHTASPVYSDATSASNFEHMPYMHGPMEPTFVLPPGMYLRPEDTGNLYTTLSANPNVFFQRAHPGMMY